jgi:hypothetical protein
VTCKGSRKQGLKEMRDEHDPLALHIFVSHRHYRNIQDRKRGLPIARPRKETPRAA